MSAVTLKKVGVLMGGTSPETSLLPKIALRSGLDFTSLVETILEDALKEGDRG